MDIDNLIAHGRSRFDHAAAKRTLKEKYQGKLIFAYNGGMFKAGPELINILKASEGQQGLYILDLYETPVIVDYKELLNLAQTRWQETMKLWFEEHEQLSKNR
jgi:hypothetical protein